MLPHLAKIAARRALELGSSSAACVQPSVQWRQDNHAAPAADDKGVFAPPCPANFPLPAAFCNILHRFSKLSSGEARASVNETCAKCQHGVAWFKSVQMRSADEGKAVFYEC